MAEEQEKDNTWLIAGVAIAAIIVLVVMLNAPICSSQKASRKQYQNSLRRNRCA